MPPGRWTNSPSGQTTLTQRAVPRLLDPSITAAGVLRAEKIIDAVRDILGDATIESLPIPYTAVTTDPIAGQVGLAAARAGRRRHPRLDRHPLHHRAACARRPVADGGILDLLPMALIAAVNADLTIAVSLGGADQDTPQDLDPTRPPARRRVPPRSG